MKTREFRGKTYQPLLGGTTIPEGAICEYNGHWHHEWAFHSLCVGAVAPVCGLSDTKTKVSSSARYWIPTTNTENTAHQPVSRVLTLSTSQQRLHNPTENIMENDISLPFTDGTTPLPLPEPDFSALFVPAFNKFLNDLIDKRVDALMLERLDSIVEREVGEQLEREVGEAVEDTLSNASLEDYFSIEDSVSDCLGDVDFSDYIGDAVGAAVDEHIDDQVDFEDRANRALKNALQNLVLSL